MTSQLQLKIFSLLLLFCSLIALLWYLFFSSDIYKPLHHIELDEAPPFSDDMDYQSILSAAQSHIEFLEKNGSGGIASTFEEIRFPISWLVESLEDFTEKIRQTPTPHALQRFIVENFTIYQAGGREGNRGRQMLVTGYYEPVFEGSFTKTAPYLYPIYSPPDDLVKEKTRDGNKTRTGRITDNGFSNYWSRSEIETLDVIKGYELAWLKDPFDAFLLHVQGSGRIRFPDDSVRAVRFASSNGLEYNSIGKLLVDEKKMSLEEVTIPAIRNYLKQHPEQLQRILHHNPRFIFFNWGDTQGPRGSSGAVLTPGRSIAIDNSALPNGAIGFLSTKQPVVNKQGEIIHWKPLNRFVFPQDSGSAIKGTGRVDLFWGHGDFAELAANHMKEDGELYFLVKKRSDSEK